MINGVYKWSGGMQGVTNQQHFSLPCQKLAFLSSGSHKQRRSLLRRGVQGGILILKVTERFVAIKRSTSRFKVPPQFFLRISDTNFPSSPTPLFPSLLPLFPSLMPLFPSLLPLYPFPLLFFPSVFPFPLSLNFPPQTQTEKYTPPNYGYQKPATLYKR